MEEKYAYHLIEQLVIKTGQHQHYDALQTLKTAVLVQQSTNKPTTPCQHTFKVFATAVMCTKCRCVYDLSE